VANHSSSQSSSANKAIVAIVAAGIIVACVCLFLMYYGLHATPDKPWRMMG
jgi:hypothetical protein